MENITNKKEFKKRVDIQVSLITAIITLTASLSIFGLCYTITYKDTINVLRDRANAVYEKVVANLNKATFNEIHTEEDARGLMYLKTRAYLSTLRETSSAEFIFTAKEAEDGTLVYVVDGFPMTELLFRGPGTAIEPELQEYIRTALSGRAVLPDKFISTQWGNFYWAFYPSLKDTEVVGVISVAFDVQKQFETYKMLASVTPIVCALCCLIAVYISFHVFRRLSNPNFKDIYNSDILTGLKNRNAFEVDINNINVSKDFRGRWVLSIDLNNLKKVNDSVGHSAGDQYIQGAADILSDNGLAGSVAYRTGGDEFTVLVVDARKEQIESWIKQIKVLMRECKIGEGSWTSMAVGYAVFDDGQDENLIDTYKRADYEMYCDKKRQKAEKETGC